MRALADAISDHDRFNSPASFRAPAATTKGHAFAVKADDNKAHQHSRGRLSCPIGSPTAVDLSLLANSLHLC
jgi:hypothetical protein